MNGTNTGCHSLRLAALLLAACTGCASVSGPSSISRSGFSQLPEAACCCCTAAPASQVLQNMIAQPEPPGQIQLTSGSAQPPQVQHAEYLPEANEVTSIDAAYSAQQQQQQTNRIPASAEHWTETENRTLGKVDTSHVVRASGYGPPMMHRRTASQPVALPPVTLSQNGCGVEACPTVQTAQMNALMKRVQNMEVEVRQSRESIATLQNSLARANTEIQRLTLDARYWQSEVKRLETSMQTQHAADIASISQISEILGSLVDEDDPGPGRPDGTRQ